MNYQYYIADVFTHEVFNGAQIAVFPNADGLGEDRMRKIANELNLWETLLYIPRPRRRADGCSRTYVLWYGIGQSFAHGHEKPAQFQASAIGISTLPPPCWCHKLPS